MAYTTINKSTDYFRTKLYTGNGAVRSITFDESVNMQPDLTWIKGRSTTASWLCNDSVRGATKRLKLDANSGESTQTGMITSFNTNGFSLGTTATSNNNGSTYASWNWKKIAGAFDIQTYAGNSNGSRTVAHNLGVIPSLIIVKNLTNSADWYTGSTTPGISFNWATDYIRLNESAAIGNDSGGNLFGAAPTSSVFTPGTNNDMNGTSNNYIAYLFGNKQGFSKVGSYTGNGNNNGPFAYTGFKPGWVLIKNLSASGSWVLIDNKRDTFNGMSIVLNPNSTAADNDMVDGTNKVLDMVSNGFKLRDDYGWFNTSGHVYIYMAIAEAPLVGTNGVTAKAR